MLTTLLANNLGLIKWECIKFMKMEKWHFKGGISAENALFAISRLKIRTWITMPLKVGFIPGFRGLVTDWAAKDK